MISIIAAKSSSWSNYHDNRPSSDQKTNRFSQGGAGHAFRKTTAGAFGPDLAKKLSQLVKMEKNVMRSMELVGRERMEVAVSCIQSN